MLPPKPIGKRQVDLVEAGQNIANAQHHRSNRKVAVVHPVKKTIIYVDPDDPMAYTDGASEAQEQPVF